MIIVNQYFGLGDIIWEQTLVKAIADVKPVIWPVMPQFVEGLNRAYPDITFVDMNLLKLDYNRNYEYEFAGAKILPLRFADSLCQVQYKDCMKSKYMLYGMDWRSWKNKAMWKRDKTKERSLFNQLGLKRGEPYNLINRFFGSNSQLVAPIKVDNGLHSVELCSIEGYSLFDWAMVIQNAANIHVVSSSICYILELLDLRAKEICIYKRIPIENNHDNYDYILTSHNYILK